MRNYGEVNKLVAGQKRRVSDPEPFLERVGDTTFLNATGFSLISGDSYSNIKARDTYIDFDLQTLFNYATTGEPKKYNDNLEEIRPDNSFILGRQYYLLNYITSDNTSSASFISKVVKKISSSQLGSGVTVPVNIKDIELYIMYGANGESRASAFSTDTLSGLKVNSSNSVSVSNVNKIVIDGLKSDSPFETGTSVTSFSSGPRRHTSNIVGTDIYVIGGSGTKRKLSKVNLLNDTTSVNTVDPLTIDSSGHCSELYGNYIYILGGEYSGGLIEDKVRKLNITTNIESGEIGSDILSGGAGALKSSSELVGIYAYIIGGSDTDKYDRGQKFNMINEVSSASIPLTENMEEHSSSFVGNYIYCIGGYQDPQKIRKTNVTNDTNLGEIGTDILNLNRVDHSSSPVGDYVYVFGGDSSTNTVEKLNTVTELIINVGAVLSGARIENSTNNYKNNVYLIGGLGNSTYEKFNVDYTESHKPTVISIRFK